MNFDHFKSYLESFNEPCTYKPVTAKDEAEAMSEWSEDERDEGYMEGRK